MRYIWIGFHILMLVLVVMAFGGALSPPPTGNFAADNGRTIMPVIGVVTIWIIGSIVLRVIRRFSRY